MKWYKGIVTMVYLVLAAAVYCVPVCMPASVMAAADEEYQIRFYDDQYVYDGMPVEPPVESVIYTDNSGDKERETILREGVDYSLRYSDNVDAGTGKITIYGRGAYTGSHTVTFSILPRELTQQNTVCEIEAGSLGSNTPKIILTCDDRLLIENLDYELSYQNNENAGEGDTAFIVVKGIQNYAGQLKIPFTMEKRSLHVHGSVSVEESGLSYTGGPLCPEISVEYENRGTSQTLVKNADYKVDYINNVNAGTGTVVVTGMGNYTGSLTGSFMIGRESISSCDIEDLQEYTFTGYPVCPTPRVMFQESVLVHGRDFTYSYENNVNAGNGFLGITGINNFSGTVYLPFLINPAESQLETDAGDGQEAGQSSSSGISNKSQSQAKKNEVRIGKPGKLKKSVRVLKGGWKIQLKWTKASKAKQYQIWYRKNGKWKKVKTTSGRMYSVTVKKKGKYEYRVRGCSKGFRGNFRKIAVHV